jgi:hypothetical protein
MCQSNVKNINRRQHSTKKATRAGGFDGKLNSLSGAHANEALNNHREVGHDDNVTEPIFVETLHTTDPTSELSPEKQSTTKKRYLLGLSCLAYLCRRGNNVYGNVGTVKCWNCRKLKSKVAPFAKPRTYFVVFFCIPRGAL